MARNAARSTAFSKAIRAHQFGAMAIRAVLYRVNFELARDPYMVRLARALTAFGIDTVLDVGANIGQFGSGLHACGYHGRIISCEPQPDAFAHLTRRSASDLRWTALRTAVGAEVGTIDINVSANSFSSSVLPMSQAHLTVAPGSGYVGTESAPMTTVEDLIREHGIDPARTLLKSDTQGYESAVFDGAGDTLAAFTAVQVELSLVPLYDGQALAPELTQRLEGLGFGVFALDPGFGDRSNGRMLQYDGLFVRADLLTDYSVGTSP